MFRQAIGPALAAGIALLGSAAYAAPQDDYVLYKTALFINEACGGLKYLEHTRTQGAAISALSGTELKYSPDDYKAWVATLDKTAADQAAALGCTQEAGQYIMRAKGIASEGIYRGLALSAHMAATPDFLFNVPIEPDRWAALLRYDAYLQAIYGENFPAFAARQKELAARELPVADPFATDYGLGLTLGMSQEDSSKIYNAQSMAGYALDEVFFEVTAETAGFIVRPRTVQSDWTIPELRLAATPTTPGLPVVDGPRYDLVDLTDDADETRQKLYSVLVLTPENRLRVMYYGDTAAALVTPTIRLYVRDKPLPAGGNAYTYFYSAAFRDDATAFDGTRVEAGCLSAACFEFPAEATDAFVAYEDNQYAELFVSSHPDAEPPASDPDAYKAGQTSNFYAYKLLRQ